MKETNTEDKKTVVVERTAKPKRKRRARKDYDVEVIPATKGVVPPGEVPPVKRVAAYCRVSTDQDAQASSYELQVKHYTEYIGAHEGWILAGIYADEGISGTQMKHREQFLKMIGDCENGKIDMILTKSISRFARNTVDCLSTIRRLKDLSPPVEIYFEKERLYSLDDKTDMVLGLMASIAQEESRSISANIRWAIKNRMKEGTQKIPTSNLLGYDTDEDGNFVIVTKEAEIVRSIYKMFLQGIHPKLIATRLNSLGLTTVFGNAWSAHSVRKILENEKYCGDVLMQKTITVDYLSHKSKKNEGEEAQYFIADHHDPIVSKDDWNKVQEVLGKKNWQNWQTRQQQRLIPIRKGLLYGFIAIGADWKDVSVKRMHLAQEKLDKEMTTVGVDPAIYQNKYSEKETKEMEQLLMEENERLEKAAILEGFEVLDLELGKGDSIMTMTPVNIKFNKVTATELDYPAYVRILVNAQKKQIAIAPCKGNIKNSIKFSRDPEKQNYSIVMKLPALRVAIRKMINIPETMSIAFRGDFYPNDGVIIYDISKGTEVKSRGKRKKEETEAGAGETEK